MQQLRPSDRIVDRLEGAIAHSEGRLIAERAKNGIAAARARQTALPPAARRRAVERINLEAALQAIPASEQSWLLGEGEVVGSTL